MDGSVFFSAILAASVLIWLGTLWRRLHITQSATGTSKGTAKLFAISLAVLIVVYLVSNSLVAFAFAPEIIVGAAFAISAFFFIGQLR
jgi:fatty acid desaturase